MAILGLASTASYANQRFKNYRRSVFYFYPNGAAPLTGIMSMLKEESTNDPEFKWWEKRLSEQRTLTAMANSAGPFTNTSGTDLTTGGWSQSAGDEIRIKVASTDVFRPGHVVKVRQVPTTGSPIDLNFIVTQIVSSSVIQVRCVLAISDALNTTAVNGIEVWVVGSAFSEGSLDTSRAISNIPTEVGGQCQIFRTPFLMTGTAVKTNVKYDESGPYQDMAKEHSVYHMTEIEKALIFSQMATYTGGDGLPVRTMKGILGYLADWESGSVYGNTAATNDSDDNKRIITNSGGALSESSYDGYLERVFRVTNNTANEKLVLCGNQFLNVINQLYKSKSCLNADLPIGDTYGMNVVKHVSPFGTVYYKTHPLFNSNPFMRANALFLDVQNLVYRFVTGRDTALLANRQPNDADYRKDEYLTECGLEVRFPESHMYLQNVQTYA